MGNLDREKYINIRNTTKDPIVLCYKIFNIEARTKIIGFAEFTKLLKLWLLSQGKTKIMSECQGFKNNFDKKFGVLK